MSPRVRPRTRPAAPRWWRGTRGRTASSARSGSRSASWPSKKVSWTSHVPSLPHGPPRRTHDWRRLSPSTASITSSRLIVVRRPREAVAARPPRGRLHEAGALEIAEHLGQEPHRDRHRVRDPARGQQAVAGAAGQGEHRAHGVVAALRQFEAHRREYASERPSVRRRPPSRGSSARAGRPAGPVAQDVRPQIARWPGPAVHLQGRPGGWRDVVGPVTRRVDRIRTRRSLVRASIHRGLARAGRRASDALPASSDRRGAAASLVRCDARRRAGREPPAGACIGRGQHVPDQPACRRDRAAPEALARRSIVGEPARGLEASGSVHRRRPRPPADETRASPPDRTRPGATGDRRARPDDDGAPAATQPEASSRTGGCGGRIGASDASGRRDRGTETQHGRVARPAAGASPGRLRQCPASPTAVRRSSKAS